MLLRDVYIRFYKSFNFDYLRKSHPKAEPLPWEVTEEGYWYPFVRVALEDGVTTVVGANESGKSQLLGAVRCVLTGHGVMRSDFCRYSQFFAIDEAMLRPDFGARFGQLTDDDRVAVAASCGMTSPGEFSSFCLFRHGTGGVVVYLQEDDGWSRHEVTDLAALEGRLPRPFDIHADVPLPDSVPINLLATGELESERSRRQRQKLLDVLTGNSGWFASPQAVQKHHQQISDAFQLQDQADERRSKELQLAEDLLVRVAGVDRSAFEELMDAVKGGHEGYANGIVDKINEKLSATLNFPRWWSQDHEFALLLTLRDLDLVFTIRDRTGTEYSFSERSSGLKYFLSYFVQFLSHEAPSDGAQEVLLMDEPDAYLSSQGQQDLLRVFEEFAHPSTARPACQVVYVTHSPFLIDKNHAERIRVLEKGEGEEGTRVVRNVARNHYEPLRSAFGAFVAETTFISNCNLMLEGQSDQILLAGLSAHLRREGAPKTENLDLNTVTLVPTGSASHIPYMAFLARGRDADRPAVIVLLDSDKPGVDARRDLLRGGPKGRQVVAEKYILQIGDLAEAGVRIDNPGGLIEIEDLVPLSVAITAARSYVLEFLGSEEADKLTGLKPKDVRFGKSSSTHAAVERACKDALESSFHLDKVGFARSIVAIVGGKSNGRSNDDLGALENNFRVLFRLLGRMQREATRDRTAERTSSRIKRARDSFLLDHPERARREDANVLFEEIDTSLDSSLDAEQLRLSIRRLQTDFGLEEDVADDIEEYDRFKDALLTLAYQEQRAAQHP
jgi:hypothetical protein